jgi:glycosidase
LHPSGEEPASFGAALAPGALLRGMSRRLGALSTVLVLWATACSEPLPDPGSRCTLVAWLRARDPAQEGASALSKPARALLVGSWNDWARPASTLWHPTLAPDGSEWLAALVRLSPGVHQYGILLGDELIPDDGNGQTAFIRNPYDPWARPFSTEVSEVTIPDCTTPWLELLAPESRAGELDALARFHPGETGAPLDPRSVRVALRRGSVPLPSPDLWRDSRETIRIREYGLPRGKYTLTVEAADTGGRAASARATFFVAPQAMDQDPSPPSLADGILYQVVIDRFRGPRGALQAPATPGDRAGGTLSGVRAAVEAGHFERLGVTTLWLSPLYRNPEGKFVGRDGHLYEAYHGYWPSAAREVDPALGGEEELDRLVASAHARGIRVIADVVPNHVFESHPYYLEHSRQAPTVANAADPLLASWFNDTPPVRICGRDGWGWTEECWFDRYLPDLNWRHPAVARQGVDDLLSWITRFDLDGLRIDAVPMMPRSATRRIVRAVRELGSTGAPLDRLVIGEVFTGPGQSGREAIRSYLGSAWDGLDSAFDFPLLWAIRSVIARGESSLEALEAEILQSQQAWAGSGAVMGVFLNNHDTSRFVSEAVGDAWGDPWRRPAVQPTEEEPYRRHLLGMALILTLPGLPVLYYGDEVALAGAGDPDSRRVLPDVLGPLEPRMAAVLAAVGRLGRLRRCSPALRRGTRSVLHVGVDTLVALHEPPSRDPRAAVLFALSRSRSEARLEIQGVPPGAYRDALSGVRLTARDGVSTKVVLPPLTAAVFLSEVNRCLE